MTTQDNGNYADIAINIMTTLEDVEKVLHSSKSNSRAVNRIIENSYEAYIWISKTDVRWCIPMETTYSKCGKFNDEEDILSWLLLCLVKIKLLPISRETLIAETKIETAIIWANKLKEEGE